MLSMVERSRRRIVTPEIAGSNPVGQPNVVVSVCIIYVFLYSFLWLEQVKLW